MNLFCAGQNEDRYANSKCDQNGRVHSFKLKFLFKPSAYFTALSGDPFSPRIHCNESISMFRCIVTLLLLTQLSTQAFAEYTIEPLVKKADGSSLKLQLVGALRRAGKTGEALKELRELLRTELDERSRLLIRYEYARMLMDQELLKEEGDRNWKEFDEAIALLRESASESPLISILEMESQLARSDLSRADRLRDVELKLQAAGKTFEQSAVFWQGASRLYLKLGKAREADVAMARFEAINQRLTESARRQPDDGQPSDNPTAEDDARVREILGYLDLSRQQLAVGNVNDSLQTLRQWADRFPSSTQPRSMMIRIASGFRRIDELARLERELKDLEDESGPWWRQARTQRLLLEAERGDEEALAEAAKLTADWTDSQPDQPLAWTMAGLVAEAQGEFDNAIAAYRTAFRLGERAPDLIHSLLGLLLLTEDHSAALRLADQLDSHQLLTPGVLPLVVQTHIKLGNPMDAAQLAERAISVSPLASEFHAALGNAHRALDANGSERAHEAYNEALELDQSSLANWVALLFCDLEQPRIPTVEVARLTNRAAALLDAYGEEMPSSWQRIVVGRCLELSGDLQLAESYYRSALQLDPSGTARQWIPSGSIVTRQVSLDQKKLQDGNATSRPVRQVLGLIRGALGGGSMADAAAAVKLLDGDPRLEAISLLNRSDAASRRAAPTRLQQIPEADQTAADHILLARLLSLHT